jgi:hypothetical protein
MAQSNGLRQFDIESQVSADCGRYRGNMQDMLNTSTDMIVLRSGENLCFPFEPSERKRMNDSSLITKPVTT